MDREEGNFEHIDINKITNRLSNMIFDVSFLENASKDELWIGHNTAGQLLRFNAESSTVQDYLLGNGQFDLVRNPTNKVWVASQNGLYIYDDVSNKFRRILNGAVYSLVSDDNGYIWANTVSKLIQIQCNTENIIMYDLMAPSGGVKSFDAMTAKGFLKSDGTILLGDGTKHYHINPTKLKLPVEDAQLHFTNLWISQKSGSSNTAPMHYSLIDQHSVDLSYTQNTFSISFTEIDFRNPSRNRIKYMLKGYDIDWRESLSEEKVFYSGAPPGEYNLVITAPHSVTGILSERSLKINISPPWYKTWWAYLLYVIALGFGVFQLDRYRKQKLITRERARTREIELRQARDLKKAYFELEKAHKDLKETQAQLIHAEKMASFGELTAGIAHEIQNPLNFVNNFSEVSVDLLQEANDELQEGDLNAAEEIIKDLQQNLNKISHHGQRASGIVKSMLDHSRASSGEKSSTDLNRLCDEYVRLAYHGMRAKDKSFNVSIDKQYDQDMQELEVVPQDIGRVILNLMTNAFFAVRHKKEAVPVGYEPKVKISTGRQSGQIIMAISDNGPGISPDIRDKIFQPFFTTKSTGSGTGLGLSLSYDIIKAHNGDLTVISEPGKGSTFKIILPLEIKDT